MNDYNGQNNNSKDNDRTIAFTVQKKERKADSISWIVTALILFFINVMSVGRITIVGQFIDDILFTLPFGWFKYFLYLLFFILDFSIYFGIKFNPKKRFIAMVIITWFVMCWLISSILFIVANLTNSTDFNIENVWSNSILKDSIVSYVNNWYSHSLWKTTGDFIIAAPESYFTLWAGGGMIGTVLAGISSYTSIYGGLVICLFFFFINMLWIFTGDPFFIFKPKNKRIGKRLRILSLKQKNPLLYQNQKRHNNYKSIFKIINVSDDDTFDEKQILASMKESDITIELPSYNKHYNYNIYDDVKEDFYHDNFESNFFDENQFSNDHQNQSLNNSNLDFYNQNKGYIESNRGFSKVTEFDHDQKIYEAQERVANNLQKQESQNYVPRRSRLFENDLPAESKYGQISTEEARKEFEKESSVTPFGANGKTQEIISSKLNKDKKNSTLNNQITLEQFINEVEQEKQLEKRYENFQDYTSPMQDNFAKTIINNSNNNFYSRSQNNRTIEVNTSKAIEKEQYVNLGYQLPSIDILNPDLNNEKDQIELKTQADLKATTITNTFNQFGVKATVNHMNIGPSVTKFEILPAPGTKVNSITSLENDLKLALANQNVRIEAPIQGKAAVGIEVPNDKSLVVPLRSVIEKTPIQKMNSKLLFAIGKTVTGDLLFGELDKMPHLLVAGSTGSGKSVMINGIISSILMRAKPHEVKFLMVDPKKVELSIYSSIPHLLAPVISDMNIANNALKKVINEMERRYALFTQHSVKNIDGYNSKQKKPSTKLPYYVIIIDELADLMMTANKRDVEDSIMRLTQMARAAGIHLIVATQRPSTDVLTGVIKSNIPTRIAFAVASSIDSRTILDSTGAEKLIGRGDLLYMPPGSSSLTRAQGAYISDDEIEKLVKYCSNQQQQIFDEEFMRSNDEIQNNYTQSGNKDSMLEEIKLFVIKEQKASTSLIQRRFSIGYNRAAKIIDELEENGVIGPQNGAKPREVFIKNEDIY
ncbi:DNA translocase FtsK [Spiroplasma taiwanense]|uniref:DNA translocase n=1 Tax=Spiroplasma taiwanense CT-1 TaxID=1276220 RepID=S5LYZ5_9MOLU|nr:DNA translocase FtsK [Spiroplasma taiwanense]AGR40917.1 DNA translocase [Spiroplasma taiwanense CT-1]